MRISPIVPEYEPRIISEDERTVILRNAAGQTVKYIKDSLERMPMYFDWSFEVAAENDVVALRKGKDLIIGGTIDKRALIKGKEATREEVMSKVPFFTGTGRLLPVCRPRCATYRSTNEAGGFPSHKTSKKRVFKTTDYIL